MPSPRQVLYFLVAGFSAIGSIGVARGQNCPGGQCPGVQWPAGRPTVGAIAATPAADYHRAIVRVGREDLARPGASFSGAGTFVARAADGRGLVLTAFHVVDEGGGRIWVDFGHGRQSASLLGHDATLDLAALAIDRAPADVRAIPVADDDEWPRAGDNVEVVGFGGGQFRHFAARARGYTTKEASGASQLVVAFQPISGDSGGPVLVATSVAGRNAAVPASIDAQARAPASPVKLAGILWGGPCDSAQQAAYETHATCCIYIRRFLNRIGVQLKPRQPPARPSPGSDQPFTGPSSVATPPTAGQSIPAAPADDSGRLATIERRLDELAAKVTPAAAAAAGAPGARGPQGLPGPAGPAGKDADPAALAALAGRVAALEKNIKGKLHFSLQVDSQTGKILSTSSGSP